MTGRYQKGGGLKDAALRKAAMRLERIVADCERGDAGRWSSDDLIGALARLSATVSEYERQASLSQDWYTSRKSAAIAARFRAQSERVKLVMAIRGISA